VPVHFRFSDIPRPIVLVAAVALVALLPLYVVDVAKTFHIDFVAFWCAGAALAHHQNPYLDESLHGCNVAHGLVPSLTLPVAHPPYVLPLFALFSLVPMPAAFALWSLLSLVCCALSTVALSRITRFHWTFTGSVVALTVAIPSLSLGQLVPLAFCGFCWALVYVRERRPQRAAAALIVASSLPNLAETAWIGAFAGDRRMRVPLVAAAAFLLLAGAAAVGFDRFAFYFRVVLQAYGGSELDAFWQLGSAATLHTLGVPQGVALRAAYALLVCLLFAGAYVGMELRKRFGGNHWIVAAVAGFGLLGSPYSHLSDVAFAVPLALMLVDASPKRFAGAAALSVVTPWLHLFQNTGIQAAICIPFLLIVCGTLFQNAFTSAAVVTAIIGFSLLIYRVAGAANLQLKAAASLPATSLPHDALAEVRWTEFSHLARSLPDAAIMHVSFYVTVGAVLWAAIRYVAKSPTIAVEKSP
jgi:Glycosyltransferase family 87